MRSARPAFTLVEALSTIAIISILVTLGIFALTQAQKSSRDARRKSDITAISSAFEARYLDMTCSNQSLVNLYPGSSLKQDNWLPVSEISNIDPIKECQPINDYISVIPSDPSRNRDYFFNLSTTNGVGKHYRLTAALERQLSESANQNRCSQSVVWQNSFGGIAYDGCGVEKIGGEDILYNHVVGR